MQAIDKAAFQDSRNALLSAKIQARLQDERRENKWLDGVLRDVERNNGFSGPVPLVNQATFLAMLYSTALWLRESYFKDQDAVVILRKHINSFVGNSDIKVAYGSSATHFSKNNPEQFARRLRNALGHASVAVNNDTFVFKDTNTRSKDDWVSIEMPWSVVGEYTMALIAAGNELLYAQPIIPPDAAR
ncbi:hypothetical protein [Ferrigenium sp. UT5]|uniref:hypothetical protein n=1 Tax=Ferrigenium sp. UT5 TaxID=3242105 RepID=UPI00354D3C7D